MGADNRVVIVGAGHGGVQAAASLREEGFEGSITLISADRHQPYQRPPLSKAYMKGEASAASLILRGSIWYDEKNVELMLDERVVAIDRVDRRACLASGRNIPYDHLILATGADPRPAPFPGTELEGVHLLRNLGDAEHLRLTLGSAQNVVVIGAGFIGLEFAATAASKGCHVQVVEVAPRVMARAISTVLSEFYAEAHRGFGVRLHLGVGVAAVEGVNRRATAVRLTDGRTLPADVIVVGIGILACDALATAAGLAVDNGIVVDASMTTSDPAISAIGDCAAHPNVFAARRVRLESVQNAIDQARVVARTVVGRPARYDALPWFWSDQGDLKLQIAGLIDGCDMFVLRGQPETRSFSIFGFGAGKLRAVESVNRPADHMIARRLITGGMALSPEQAADPSFDLKACIARPAT